MKKESNHRMILVRDIRLPLSAGEPQAFEKALHLARVPRAKVGHLGVAKLSVDARHGQPKLVYTVAVTLKDEGEESAYAGASPCVALHQKVDFSVQNGTQPLVHRPVVCGLGPAGLFAALLLARMKDAELAPLETVAEDVGVDPTVYYTTRTLGQAFLEHCDPARMASFAPLFAGSADAGRAALAALLPNTFLQALVWQALTAPELPEVTEHEDL